MSAVNQKENYQSDSTAQEFVAPWWNCIGISLNRNN